MALPRDIAIACNQQNFEYEVIKKSDVETRVQHKHPLRVQQFLMQYNNRSWTNRSRCPHTFRYMKTRYEIVNGKICVDWHRYM